MSSKKQALILFLAVQPEGTSQIRLDAEARGVQDKLREAKLRNEVCLESRWAVQPDDVMDALTEHHPDVVHFSGHGNKKAELLLESSRGGSQPVTGEALAGVFRAMGKGVKAVVLNSCYSDSQAKEITRYIDLAVGMNEAIGTQAAIHFSVAFYRALGDGKSFHQSFEEGKAALLLHGVRESHIPVLHAREGVDPREIFLLSTEGVRIGSLGATAKIKINKVKVKGNVEGTGFVNSSNPKDRAELEATGGKIDGNLTLTGFKS